MRIDIFIGRRLSLKSESEGSTAPGVVTAIAGVALAVAIMLLSIAIVKGFKQEITSKLEGFNSQLMLNAVANSEGPASTSGIRLTDTLLNIIGSASPAATTTLVYDQPAIFKTADNFQGIILKGYLPGEAMDFYADNLIEGSIPQLTDSTVNTVIISSTTASMLGVKVGEKLTTHFLKNNRVRSRSLIVAGIFDTHFHDFDAVYAITPIKMLQQLNKVDSITGTSVEISGIGIDNLPAVQNTIIDRTITANMDNPDCPILFSTRPVTETCAQYFSWLDLLDTNVVVIIILMACVSGFTLISSLFIIILERINTIGLLKALGATNAQIRRIFIYMAQRLVLKGMIIGNIIAIAFMVAQSTWHVLPLDPDAYYLNYVPVYFSWSAFIVVNLAVIVMAILILILPSQIVSRLSPSKSLRFE